MGLANRLREYRERESESLAQVADAVDIDRGNLWRIERGERRCTAELALKLAAHFGVAVEDLFFAESVA